MALEDLTPSDVIDARNTLIGDIQDHCKRTSAPERAALADYLLKGDYISDAYFEMLRETR